MTNQPDNLRKNALGHFVPESLIAPLDLLRDDLVTRLCNEAHEEKLRLLARGPDADAALAAFTRTSTTVFSWGVLSVRLVWPVLMVRRWLVAQFFWPVQSIMPRQWPQRQMPRRSICAGSTPQRVLRCAHCAPNAARAYTATTTVSFTGPATTEIYTRPRQRS